MKKVLKISLIVAVFVVFIILSACQNQNPAQASGTTAAATTTAGTVKTSTADTTSAPATGSATYSTTMNKVEPTVEPTDVLNSEYVVFAWNDLGMHCLNPTYDQAVILPPYNTIWAQVVKRGNPPQVVTQSLTVEYKFSNNTYSYGKASYGQFWDNAQKLFGGAPEKDKGLNLKDPQVSNGLSGQMALYDDHFEVVGAPLTPIDDSSNKSAYQVAEITVKDSSGNVVAQTKAMAPVSDEINCTKCHGDDAFNDVLVKHDKNQGTDLVNSKPVLCASCHGDPALGSPKTDAAKYLSDAVHGYHANVSTVPACYDCHPGQVTKCSRSIAHTAEDGNCITCHGDLAKVSSSISVDGRVPWANEPKCVTCHAGVDQVDTGDVLYRNSAGHGGMYCASCHSSPHSMVPTTEVADNYQALQYQGKAVSISSCILCHHFSSCAPCHFAKGQIEAQPGENSQGNTVSEEFKDSHTGPNPENANACFICHTQISANAAQWPHSFQWKARRKL